MAATFSESINAIRTVQALSLEDTFARAFSTKSEKSLKQETNPVQIGQDVAKAEEYLAFAKEGCGFLMVHAPEEDRTKQAIAIAHPFGLKFAEKYNRLTLEELA